MKKTIAAIAVMASSVSAFASGSASATYERVTDRVTKSVSDVRYYRFNNEIGNGLMFNTQVRDGRAQTTGALSQSTEVGLTQGFGSLFVGGGVGRDFGLHPYNYTYVVGGAAQKLGPVTANAGVKYTTGFNSVNPTSVLTFAGVSYPLTKTLSVEGGVSRTYREIHEKAVNVSLRVGF